MPAHSYANLFSNGQAGPFLGLAPSRAAVMRVSTALIVGGTAELAMASRLAANGSVVLPWSKLESSTKSTTPISPLFQAMRRTTPG